MAKGSKLANFPLNPKVPVEREGIRSLYIVDRQEYSSLNLTIVIGGKGERRL